MSKEVVPRWEWRTFGHDLGDGERWFAAREAERAEESDETYLLSRLSDASVKVRGGLLDVKRLEPCGEPTAGWPPGFPFADERAR